MIVALSITAPTVLHRTSDINDLFHPKKFRVQSPFILFFKIKPSQVTFLSSIGYLYCRRSISRLNPKSFAACHPPKSSVDLLFLHLAVVSKKIQHSTLTTKFHSICLLRASED